MDLPSLRRETIYGMPAADHVIFNRHYILGYSYYFRQAKWALEIIDSDDSDIDRPNNFRSDQRIPEMFRADLADYNESGYDRGHLIASANHKESELQNSETFLLSNMSPQKPLFNREIWKKLEEAVRNLNAKSQIMETFVVSGPIFYFDKPFECIGENDSNKVSIPIPHAFFKSILTENNKGKLYMWSFILPNEETDRTLDSFLVPTKRVEQLAGIKLWERLTGKKIAREESRVRKMW